MTTRRTLHGLYAVCFGYGKPILFAIVSLRAIAQISLFHKQHQTIYSFISEKEKPNK